MSDINVSPSDLLRAHSTEFKKKVYELAPDRYLAVGFAASNVGMIIGDDGLIIIDTTESTEAAQNVLAQFRKITDKPVETIIYTHSHRDHICGASVFAEGRDVEIIAHHQFSSDLIKTDDAVSPDLILQRRTVKQFGIGLEFDKERINLGLGPGDRPTGGLGAGHVQPNLFVDTTGQVLERCGVSLQMHFAPGECDDNLVVFLPQHRVLFSADNYYKGFPNLYAIRGTTYRDFIVWADSLRQLQELDAMALAPGHSQPLYGADEISSTLSNYEEAIRFVVTKTAEGMNQGLTPDELVEYVMLPEHLRKLDYLQEFYGHVAWSVRSYFSGTLGWFDGDPAKLFPLSPAREAENIVKLAGGFDAVVQVATQALECGEHQWALELTGRLLTLEPLHEDIRALRVSALRNLAELQMNACARNYYLVSAKELEG